MRIPAWRGHRAQSLTEFALILPLLSMLLVGTIDVARAYHAKIVIANASRVAAEYAANWKEADSFQAMTSTQYRTAAKLPSSVADPPACATTNKVECGKERATLAARWLAVRETGSLGIGLSDVSMTFGPTLAASTATDTDWVPNTMYRVTVAHRFSAITPMANSLWGGGMLALSHYTDLRHNCSATSACTYS